MEANASIVAVFYREYVSYGELLTKTVDVGLLVFIVHAVF